MGLLIQNRTPTLALALLLVPLAARAQTFDPNKATPLSLRDALSSTVRQNPAIVSSGVDIAISEAIVYQSLAVNDTLINADASWYSSRSDAVAGQPFQQLALDQFAIGGGVTIPFRDGGRLGVRLSNTYQRAVTLFALSGVAQESESVVWSPALTVTFFQPLLRGFGSKNVHAPEYRAKAQKNVVELNRAATASSSVRDVIGAYWDLAYVEQDVEIRRQSLALSREQLRLTNARLEVGLGAPVDATAVEQGIAASEEQVLRAEQAVATASLELRRLAGMEIGPGQVLVTPTDKLTASYTEIDPEEALRRAMENNPQLAALRGQEESAELDVELTENGLLPQLDFTASGGPRGNADDLGTALDQMVTFGSYDVRAAVVFSMPLGNHNARGANRVAKESLRKVKVTQADVRAQVTVAVGRAYDAVVSSQKRLEVLEKSEKLALVNLDAEQARYEAGEATNFDVLQRQDTLQQARLARARAQADYLKAVANLQSLTGDLLPSYGLEVRVEP